MTQKDSCDVISDVTQSKKYKKNQVWSRGSSVWQPFPCVLIRIILFMLQNKQFQYSPFP